MKRAFSPGRPNAYDSIADRAGRWSPNRSAHTWLNSGRSRCRSRMTIPTRTTSAMPAPAAARIAARLSNSCSASARASSGMARPRGSAPNSAETWIQPPASTAWGTGPVCAGASSVWMTRMAAGSLGAVDLDGAEAVELERDAAAPGDRDGGGHPAREDQLPGAQPLPRGELVDQPGPRRRRVAHHRRAGRGHRDLAVDPDDAADQLQVGQLVGPAGDRAQVEGARAGVVGHDVAEGELEALVPG